jgi:hypothetical protein
MPTSRRPNPVNAKQGNVLSAVPSQRMGKENPSRSPAKGQAALALFGGGDGGFSSLGNFVSNPGDAISNSPVGKAVSAEAQKAGNGVSTLVRQLGSQASAGATAVSKGAGRLPSLGNASATFGGYTRMPNNIPSPNPSNLGKQLGNVAPGVPKLPTGLGKAPIVANPSVRVPKLPNAVVNGGKHVLGQAASLGKEGVGIVANSGKQIWGRGPVMADPTPPAWNWKPFPHATLGSNGRIPFDYGFGPIHGEFMIPTRGHLFGQHHVGFNPYYEIGIRNQTVGDLVIDAIGFAFGAEFPLSPFANVAADTLEPWINWAATKVAVGAAHKINDSGHPSR